MKKENEQTIQPATTNFNATKDKVAQNPNPRANENIHDRADELGQESADIEDEVGSEITDREDA